MYEAIIFDCDGTLADSMPPHYLAWVETLERYKIQLSEDLFYEMGGWPSLKVIQFLLERDGIEGDAEKMAQEKEDAFEKHIHAVEPIEQVIEVVRKHHQKIPLAVATGGIPHVCHGILDTLGIRNCFDAIVTAHDVVNAKPAPDIYLEAAKRLGVDPKRCQAYEDTDPGIESARAAGMDVVDVRDFFQPRRVSDS